MGFTKPGIVPKTTVAYPGLQKPQYRCSQQWLGTLEQLVMAMVLQGADIAMDTKKVISSSRAARPP